MLLNRVRRPLAVCCALLVAPVCAAVSASTPNSTVVTLRVAAQAGTEPKFIAAGNGRIVGLCVDIYRAIERVDPGLVFVGDQQWMPLIRAYSELASHQHDAMCAVPHSTERDAQFTFLDPPLFPLTYMLVARIDDRVTINDWNDVRKLGAEATVLVNRGYNTAEYLERLGGMQVNSSATDPLINLQKLIAHRGRFFLHRGPGLEHFLRRAGLADKVRIMPRIMYETPSHMVMGTHVDPAIVERVRRDIDQLDKSGDLARLLKKWE